MRRILLAALLLGGCAIEPEATAPEAGAAPTAPALAVAPVAPVAPAAGSEIRVRKEGGSAGRIDLFAYDPNAGRGQRLAHCPEGCFEATALVPPGTPGLEVVATGWPYLRMTGWRGLAACARTDRGFMSPCRITQADIPAEGIVAVFIPRPGFEEFGVAER